NEVFNSFDIQISSDGKKWRTAATVPAQNTPVAQYEYFLNEAVSGTQYYRLSSSKKGGEIEYSYILKYTENQTNNRFSVYPNPLSDNSIIHFWSSFAEDAQITLCNFEGQSIATRKVNLVKGSNSFPLPRPGMLKKGIYIAKVETGTGIYQLKVMF
ncbi:MAG: T9SS type A sorting domain-containing protein, partial [Chitinophagaceae bacterium]